MSSQQINSIIGTAIPLRGDDIDTDRIIPARYLRCVTFDGLGKHAFEDDREQDPDHPFNQEKFSGATILIVGRNFGCGSSREHAPQSLYRRGIKGIVGESIAEIFFGNCQAMGVPCVTVGSEDCESLLQAAEQEPDQRFEIDVAGNTVRFGDRETQGHIPAGVQRSFLEGTWNATTILMQAGDAIDDVAAALPYLRGFDD